MTFLKIPMPCSGGNGGGLSATRWRIDGRLVRDWKELSLTVKPVEDL
jgi:hypothetical protein